MSICTEIVHLNLSSVLPHGFCHSEWQVLTNIHGPVVRGVHIADTQANEFNSVVLGTRRSAKAQGTLVNMAENVFVELQYRGLDLGSNLRMEEFFEEQAFLHCASPMPVGTEVTIQSDDIVIVALVAHVNEAVAGQEVKVGMVVSPVDLEGTGLDWWKQRVAKAAKDMKTVVIPAVDASELADKTTVMEVVKAEEIAGAMEDASQTTVMDKVDIDAIANAQEDSSQTTVMESVAPEEVAEAGETTASKAESEESASEEKPKKKKRRTRRKKR